MDVLTVKEKHIKVIILKRRCKYVKRTSNGILKKGSRGSQD